MKKAQAQGSMQLLPWAYLLEREANIMAITEKSTMKTEVIFSDDRQHRFLLRKEWDKSKKKVVVIMVKPSYADAMLLDQTTMYVINNLHRLDFGGVDIVNVCSSLDGLSSAEEHIEKENLEHILASAAKADSIIIAWGKAGDSSKAVLKQQDYVVSQLEQYMDKLWMIEFHPLAPRMRGQWKLEKFNTV